MFHCARILPKEKGKPAAKGLAVQMFSGGITLGAGLHFDGELPSESSCMETLAMTYASLLRAKKK